jgi:hypothetical protein
MGYKNHPRALIVTSHNAARTSGSGFLKIAGNILCSGARGVPMTRAGSIIGVSSNVDITVFSVAGSVSIDYRVDNVSFLTHTLTVSGGGQAQQTTTQAREIDTFVAGDLIHAFWTHISGTFTAHFMGTIEVEFDT